RNPSCDADYLGWCHRDVKASTTVVRSDATVVSPNLGKKTKFFRRRAFWLWKAENRQKVKNFRRSDKPEPTQEGFYRFGVVFFIAKRRSECLLGGSGGDRPGPKPQVSKSRETALERGLAGVLVP